MDTSLTSTFIAFPPFLFLSFFFLFFFFFNIIYLAALGLHRGMWTLSCGIWNLVLWPGIKSNLGPLHWVCRVLATQPPGKSIFPFIFLPSLQFPKLSILFLDTAQSVVIHTVKGFGIVNKAEIDIFLELSCFFDDPANVGNLISGSSAFSKASLNI